MYYPRSAEILSSGIIHFKMPIVVVTVGSSEQKAQVRYKYSNGPLLSVHIFKVYLYR